MVVVVVVVVVVIVTASHAKCIPSLVLAVARRLKCLSSHVETSRYIAAIVTRHKDPVAPAIADHAGNRV